MDNPPQIQKDIEPVVSPDLSQKFPSNNRKVLMVIVFVVCSALILFSIVIMLVGLKNSKKAVLSKSVISQNKTKSVVKSKVTNSSKFILVKKSVSKSAIDLDLVYQDNKPSVNLTSFQVLLLSDSESINPNLSKITVSKVLMADGLTFPVSNISGIAKTKNIDVSLMGIKLSPDSKVVFTPNQVIASLHLVLTNSATKAINLTFDKSLTKILSTNDQNILGSMEGVTVNVE